MSSPCRRSAALMDPFLDGELSADRSVEVEQHVADCDCCREHLMLGQAMRMSLQRVAREDAQPSAEFAARVARALGQERERQEGRRERRVLDERSRPLSWRFIVPVAAAAGLTLVWGASELDRGQRARVDHPMSTSTPTVTASVDELIDDLVSYHAQARDPEVTEPSMVQKLEPEIGVPVPEPSLQKYGLRWEGASVVPVRTQNQRAASLRYSFDGHRVTLYVYNSARFPLRATLEPRVVRNTSVFVGSRRGYSIAAVEKRGVGYAVASDLDDRESAELAVASTH